MKFMNVIQCKSQRQKRETQKNQGTKNNSHKGKAMKHNDQENKTVQGHRDTQIT